MTYNRFTAIQKEPRETVYRRIYDEDEDGSHLTNDVCSECLLFRLVSNVYVSQFPFVSIALDLLPLS